MLAYVYRRDGLDAGRSLAEQMLDRVQDCEIVDTAGMIEFYFRRDIDSIYQMVTEAKEASYRNPEHLLLLELMLSDFIEEYDSEQIIEAILSRRDLTSAATLTALIQKANLSMERQLWSQADSIAEHILSVSEQTDARLIKWALCLNEGRAELADEHFANAMGKMPDHAFNVIAGQQLLFIGQRQQAMEYLYNGDLQGFKLHQSGGELGKFIRGDEFRRFCMEKEPQ